MGLINEEKIVEKSWQLSCEVSDKFENLGPLTSSVAGVETGKGFSLGIRFAEEELKNLAIKFAKWKDLNFFELERHLNRPVIYISYDKSESQEYTIESLFQKFVEEIKNK